MSRLQFATKFLSLFALLTTAVNAGAVTPRVNCSQNTAPTGDRAALKALHSAGRQPTITFGQSSRGTNRNAEMPAKTGNAFDASGLRSASGNADYPRRGSTFSNTIHAARF